MKAKLVPVYFKAGRDEGFDAQVTQLRSMLAETVEILEPVALGEVLPKADAVVFPQILGEAYRQVEDFRRIEVPILIITSEFGTVSMWDWEIGNFLREKGMATIAPYNLEQAKALCRALAVKRELRESKFVVFQDDPGEGFQPQIFKCFYWWEDECIERMREKFGITMVKKSFRELGERAKQVSEERVKEILGEWEIAREGLSEKALGSAVKMYAVLRDELDEDSAIKGMGINCLNESRFSDTVPCLAWSMLYQERGLIWGCEADTMGLMTKYIVNKSLGCAIIMTNVYPFLMGMAALKHERIPYFPEVAEEPENHILLAHCGYFGLVPKAMASEWVLKPKVLAIVDENAHVIDARLPVGEATLIKLGSTMDKMMVVEGKLEGYVQYEDSDCVNGGVLRVPDGHALMNNLYSHHQCIMNGHAANELEMIGKVFGITMERF
jgi:hypothetical protein